MKSGGRRGRSKTKKLCLSSDPDTGASKNHHLLNHPGQHNQATQSHIPTTTSFSSNWDQPSQTSSQQQINFGNVQTPTHRTPGGGGGGIGGSGSGAAMGSGTSSGVGADSPALRPKNLGRIKSLSKIEIRSPIVKKKPGTISTTHNSPSQTPLLGPSSHEFNELESLETVKTNVTLSSRLLGIVLPESFYTLRNYYNDFTTIDWVQAFIATNRFNFEVSKRSWIVDTANNEDGNNSNTNPYEDDRGLPSRTRVIPFYYKAYFVLGKWALIVLIAFFFSIIAFSIDKIEVFLVGFKHGYCRTNWLASQISCCESAERSSRRMNIFKSGLVGHARGLEQCTDWVSWSEYFQNYSIHKSIPIDYVIYVSLTLFLAYLACTITLTTKITSYLSVVTTRSSNNQISQQSDQSDGIKKSSESSFQSHNSSGSSSSSNDIGSSSEVMPNARVIYTASGSGVPEVRTILSGFFIRRFLGTYTLFAKTVTLILAIASGMSLGKEGPYVHLATCVGNIITRLFPYIDNNDFMKKQILSASASSGVALAFGSPLGGVLFILEEINNYLPSNQLFQVFFCAIISTLFLKFLNPYGTGKTVLFELEYSSDWKPYELVFFVLIGIFGGIFGAAFVKFVHWWDGNFRRLPFIKNKPKVEVFFVSLLTGVVTFWNPYTKQAASELVLDLATSCPSPSQAVEFAIDRSLCPRDAVQYSHELKSLVTALVVKILLTFVTFGLKVPCGIYVPSMVVGSLFGRIFGMLLHLAGKEVDLGIYSMISAGAFMAGVTRMNITLVTILFELTSSYTYVLPIAIAIAVANWMGGVLEKNSLYESLLISNDYPFMSLETEPLDPSVKAGDILNESDTYSSEDDKLKNMWNDINTSASSHAGNAMDSVRAPLNYIDSSTSTSNAAMGGGMGRPPHKSSGNSSPLLCASGLLNSEYVPLREMNINNENRKLYIDLSSSPYVAASILQSKLVLLAEKSLLDGCIPLLMHDTCVGLIFFSELEFFLDKIEAFVEEYSISDEIYCKLLSDEKFYQLRPATTENIQLIVRNNHQVITKAFQNYHAEAGLDYFSYRSMDNMFSSTSGDNIEFFQLFYDMIDLSDSLDYHPIFINHDSELTLAHLLFDRIGNRVIVLLKEGRYYGVLHKKVLIDYCRQEDSS